MIPAMRKTFPHLAVALGIAWAAVSPAAHSAARPMEVAHRLEVELHPARRLLVGRDDLRVTGNGRAQLVFSLSERARDLAVEVNGRPRSFTFRGSSLEVPLAPEERDATVDVRIAYQAVFDDPAPVGPFPADNPGFGVSALITEQGAFLLPGAGWYPDLIDAQDRFPHIRILAPPGMLAVTSGRTLGHEEAGDRSISRWQAERVPRGLALAAGRWRVRTKAVGEVSAAVYFTETNLDLAPAYLESAATYLRLYGELFGPYPYEQFAVVENFFPTGYGFPAFTLLGGSILRLPFIREQSLAHEIAHCWWGNGVLVDFEQGNWSEGLTTYVADHLLAARRSEEEARETRRQSLRNFATLVPRDKDFPLARFTHRHDPVSRAVGYDKAMMVFHMLHRQVGEEVFWGALRDLFAARRFQPTGWDHLREAFERRAGVGLAGFFDPWVGRRGVPEIELKRVERTPTAEGGWKVSGRLGQSGVPFPVDLDLAVKTAAGTSTHRVALRGGETEFAFDVSGEPLELRLDPDHHTLRRLFPEEIPPTVNSLRGSPAATAICGPQESEGLARTLVEALGLRDWRFLSHPPMNPAAWRDRNVIFLGIPDDGRWLARLPETNEPPAYALHAAAHAAAPEDLLFVVSAHPAAEDRVVAVFSNPASPWAFRAAALLPHYGRYSRLVFREGRVRERRTWETTNVKGTYRWSSSASGRSAS